MCTHILSSNVNIIITGRRCIPVLQEVLHTNLYDNLVLSDPCSGLDKCVITLLRLLI